MKARLSARGLTEGAVRLLATGEPGIKARLLQAHLQYLQHVRMAELPMELAPLLVSARRRLGFAPHAQSPCRVEATLELMDVTAAMKLADDIFEFHCALSQGLHH